MKGKIIITILMTVLLANANSQVLDTVKKHRFIPGNYTCFSVDNLDNVYLISASNQLKKLGPNGDSLTVFNDIKRFGTATLLDVSNPVKILLYYKGFSTIVMLDGMLTLRNSIDLRRKNIFNVNAVGLSYDGNIWLYDEMENALKKIDDEGNPVFKTSDFRQVFGNTLSPVSIFDQNQNVYLYDSLKGIYVFDYYGAYKKKINITNWHSLQVINNMVYGVKGNKFHTYNLETLKDTELPLPTSITGDKQYFFTSKRLYVLRDDGLEIYIRTVNK